MDARPDCIVQSLREAAVIGATGRRYVRQNVAMRIMGLCSAQVRVHRRTGRIVPVRETVRPCVAAPTGVMVWWPLAQVEALYEHLCDPDRYHAWSTQEVALLRNSPHLPARELARRLNRPIQSVYGKRRELGLNSRWEMQSRNYLTLAQVAKVCACHRCTVRAWIQNRGLPAVGVGRGWMYVHQRALTSWLIEHPRELARLPAATIEALKLQNVISLAA